MTAKPFHAPVVCLILGASLVLSACGRSESTAPPVATPTVTLSHDRAPAGSPLELTYRFVVADDAKIDGDYRVMVHVVDSDEEQMWTFDHDPDVPTSRWKPGETIEYKRLEFVPVYPYVGEASVHVGLYSRTNGTRLPLNGEHVGQNAYRVARLVLLPQSENLLTVYKDGWHGAESVPDNPMVEWQWTRKEATLAFRNPKKEATLYLEVDSPGAEFHQDQTVEVLLGDEVVDSFTVTPKERELRRVKLPAEAMGGNEMAELKLRVDNTFTPAKANPGASSDTRELGVRVFHAFVDAR